jgi:hypothetical protein
MNKSSTPRTELLSIKSRHLTVVELGIIWCHVMSQTGSEVEVMQPTHSFDPKAVSLLSGILAEIEAEHEAQGLHLDDAMREWIAHKIMDAASRGVSDHHALKACALNGP